MKKFFTTSYFLFAVISLGFAQLPFSVSPNPSIVQGDSSIFDIVAHATITNTTNSAIPMKWTRTEVQLDDRITTQFCDCVLCYAPFVSEKTFTLNPGESCDFDVHFNNTQFINPTASIVHIKAESTANPADTLTIVYLLNPNSSTSDPLPAAGVTLYPNPVTTFFSLNHADAVGAVRIITTAGRLAARYEAQPAHIYSVADLSPGSYYVVLEDKKGRMFQVIQLVR